MLTAFATTILLTKLYVTVVIKFRYRKYWHDPTNLQRGQISSRHFWLKCLYQIHVLSCFSGVSILSPTICQSDFGIVLTVFIFDFHSILKFSMSAIVCNKVFKTIVSTIGIFSQKTEDIFTLAPQEDHWFPEKFMINR